VTRGGRAVLMVTGAVALGGGGWFLGPWWALAGVLAGPPVAVVAYGTLMAFYGPEAQRFLDRHQWDEALTQADLGLPTLRLQARKWPAFFGDVLAIRQMQRAQALHGLGRDEEALRAVEEAVGIFRYLEKDSYLADGMLQLSRIRHALGDLEESLAAAAEATEMYRALTAARPGGYRADLAEALTDQATALTRLRRHDKALEPVREAQRIYQDGFAWDRLPDDAPRAWLTEGVILTCLERYRDASRSFARAWRLRGGRDEPLPGQARHAMSTAYRSDPEEFTDGWHQETGADPPLWL